MFVVLCAVVSTGCMNTNHSPAGKMFSSVETVKEGLKSDCFFLSGDGKCLVFFFDNEAVEINEILEDGSLDEVFKTDGLQVSTNSDGRPIVLLDDRGEFSPEELIIYNGPTYKEFDLYSPGELKKKGIRL